MSKLKVLVTGANGFLGSALVHALRQNSYEVFAGARKAYSNDSYEVVLGDLTQPIELSAPFEVDAIVHCAARAHQMQDSAPDPLKAYRETNVLGLKHVVEAFKPHGLKRVILISSIKVLGEKTERHPFNDLSTPNPCDPYALSKWEAEQWLIENAVDFDYVILRPPLIIGFEAKGNIEKLLVWVKNGIPLPLKGIHNQRSMIELTYFCDLISKCLASPLVRNKTFCVANKHLSTPDFVRLMCRQAGLNPKIFYCPAWLLKLIALFVGKKDMVAKLTDSLRVDASEVLRRLQVN